MSKLEQLRAYVRLNRYDLLDSEADEEINAMTPVAIIEAFDFIDENPWVVQ